MIMATKTTSTTSTALLLAVGAVAGAAFVAAAAVVIQAKKKKNKGRCQYCGISNGDGFLTDNNDGGDAYNCARLLHEAQNKRIRLPSLVILVRHGESESNADHTLWRTKPDNMIELSEKGIKQAKRAGQRIERIFQRYDGSSSINNCDSNNGFGNNKESADDYHDDDGGSDGSSPDDDDDDDDDSTISTPSTIPTSNKKKEAPLGTTINRIRRVHLIVSPFERTLQTAQCLRPYIEHRICRTDVEPRIREQEFGNLQGDDFDTFRQQQKQVGRFWYRFPTGESGADVYGRCKSWWSETVLGVNDRYGYEPIDALVIVTHGLTMRFVLMQLFHWSPTTFHSVWNAGNCDCYVLRKDLQKPGASPYVLDTDCGDYPKSSIDVFVEFKNGTQTMYKLHNYLAIPPPRTTKLDMIKELLREQNPDTIHDKDDIVAVTIAPFASEGPAQKSTEMAKKSASLRRLDSRTIKQIIPGEKKNLRNHLHQQTLETSLRFPHLTSCASITTTTTPVLLDNLDQDPKEWRNT